MPYFGSDPVLSDIQEQITALSNRVAALDGVGLLNPTLAWTTVEAKKVEGIRESLTQSILLVQQMITTLQSQVSTLQGVVNHLTGS